MEKNKVALITGGSSGIGREIAIQLAKIGITVCINYTTSTEKAEQVKYKIEDSGGKAILFKADITKENEVKNLFSFLKSHFNSLDILVNNAGKYMPDFIESHDIKNWDTIIETNLKSKLLCTKYAIPLLRKSSTPKIINIATRAAIKPMEESVAYCCAAAGTIMFTQVSAIELAKYNIKVNAVSPGLIRTPMTQMVDTDEDFENYAQKNPSGRIGTTNDIANTVKFLISEEAEFINGENINVSGGIILK